nr:hypothetical protein [Tanacetum cinerariifolium]
MVAWFLGFEDVLSWLFVERKRDAITVDMNAIALLRQAIGSSPGRNNRTTRPESSSGNLACEYVFVPRTSHNQRDLPRDIPLDRIEVFSFFIIAVQTLGSGISILLAVRTPSTGSGNLYCQWELSSSNTMANMKIPPNDVPADQAPAIHHRSKQMIRIYHSTNGDLPEADMKEILLKGMWETRSYKTHKDNKNLYEALEKSMDRDHSDQLQADPVEASKKCQKRSDSPRTLSGSPPPPPPPPPPSPGASSALGAFRSSRLSQLPLPPPSSYSKPVDFDKSKQQTNVLGASDSTKHPVTTH